MARINERTIYLHTVIISIWTSEWREKKLKIMYLMLVKGCDQPGLENSKLADISQRIKGEQNVIQI